LGSRDGKTEFETCLGFIERPCLRRTEESGTWWLTPVILDIWLRSGESRFQGSLGKKKRIAVQANLGKK
jgi:hypothetical protein